MPPGDPARSPPGAVFQPVHQASAAQKNGALGVIMIQAPGRQSPLRGFHSSSANLGFAHPSMTLGPAPTKSAHSAAVRPDSRYSRERPGSGRRQQAARDQRRQRPRPVPPCRPEGVKHDRNVMGCFRASDPEKKKEVIFFSAHYDHVGVNEKGEIFNGSDDNASGTSSHFWRLLKRSDRVRSRRESVAFLWVSGEEKGLLGSEWFSNHPTLPSDSQIVADINLDMVSRNDPRKIGITPSPRHRQYNSLIPAAQGTCKAEGMEAVFDADQFYGRTDSFNFSKKGIPVIFFFAGIHADYHQPTDDFEKADLEKAARVCPRRLSPGLAGRPEPGSPRQDPFPVRRESEPAVT